MFRTFWDEFWHLNASQRSASLILLLLLIGLLCSNYVYTHKATSKSIADTSLLKMLDSLEQKTQLKEQEMLIIRSTYIPDSSNHTKDYYPKKAQKEIVAINLNQIDTSFTHPFLYPKTIQRIVKYRNSLGGFYDKTQLKEVYGISEALYTKLEPHIILKDEVIQRLDLNLQTFQEINKHPYIDYETTKLIVNARKNKKLTSEDLKILLDNDLYLKIVPYINL